MIDLPENELLQRAQAGDTQAEGELFAIYDPACARFARQRTRGSPERFDDAYQAARMGFLHAVRKFRDEARGPFNARLSTYVHRCMYGFVINELGARGKVEAGFESKEPADFDRLSAEQPTPEERVAVADLQSQMAALVQNSPELDDVDREIYARRLVTAEPEAFYAIADDVGMSRESVRLRAKRLEHEILPALFASLR